MVSDRQSFLPHLLHGVHVDDIGDGDHVDDIGDGVHVDDIGKGDGVHVDDIGDGDGDHVDDIGDDAGDQPGNCPSGTLVHRTSMTQVFCHHFFYQPETSPS